MDKEKFNANLTKIAVLHSILSIVAMVLVGVVNIRLGFLSLLSDAAIFWITASLIGLVGAFLNFSRKSYVYQITAKYDRIANDTEDSSSIPSKISGYYVYLIFRPSAGLTVGPITAMIMLGGLSAISKVSGETGLSSLSETGHYVIYLGAFVGGYTSSELFDALSKFGSKIINPKN